jgi:hypothetical protein
MPRFVGVLLAAVLLILAAVFLAPLLPAGLGAFAYYALLIVGVVVGVWGLYLLFVHLTRGGPRDPAV